MGVGVDPTVELPKCTRNHARGLEEATRDEPSKHPRTDAELTLASGERDLRSRQGVFYDR
jgi:hypothetical protein